MQPGDETAWGAASAQVQIPRSKVPGAGITKVRDRPANGSWCGRTSDTDTAAPKSPSTPQLNRRPDGGRSRALAPTLFPPPTITAHIGDRIEAKARRRRRARGSGTRAQGSSTIMVRLCRMTTVYGGGGFRLVFPPRKTGASITAFRSKKTAIILTIPTTETRSFIVSLRIPAQSRFLEANVSSSSLQSEAAGCGSESTHDPSREAPR